MSQRYFARISFDGTDFHGWQRQPNVSTIQESIETALQRITKSSIHCHGCSRTDAGVHAKNFYAHFDIDDSDIPIDVINHALPESIAIHELLKVDKHCHAQRDATTRTYHYFFHITPDPFLIRYSLYFSELPSIDIEEINALIQVLMGIHDFRQLCKTPDRHDHTVCHLEEVSIEQISSNQYRFTIQGNRFLKRMVRRIIGQTFAILKGEESADSLKRLVDFPELSPKFVHFAPPQGLILSRVQYPYIEVDA